MNVNKGEYMQFKIDHTNKKVYVKGSAGDEVIKAAGLSATHHGYELVLVF